MSRRRFVVLLALALTTAAATPAEEPSRLTFDVIFGDHPGGRSPSQLAWTPGGLGLSYLWSPDDGEATLRLLDPASGEERTLLDPAAIEGFSLDAYHWSPDGGALLVESNGDLYLHTLATAATRRLTETESPERNPAFSPDGRSAAFVRDWDLHLIDLESGRERALTRDGEENVLLNGITDWVYWEEIWGRTSTGFWWGPQSDRIAFYRFDESPVGSYPLVDFTEVYPEVEWQKYPTAGEANPIVQVGVVEIASGDVVWLDTGTAPEAYLARVDWLPDGRHVAVQRLEREQNRLELMRCEAASGRCSTLLTEEWPTWINLSSDLTFLADGSFVWSSEKSGWRRLYLHASTGEPLRALSPEGWAVASLAVLVESGGFVLYTAHATGELGALHRRVFRQDLDGGAPRPLTPPGAWSGAMASPDSGSWVHTQSRSGEPTTSTVRDGDGRELAVLPSTPPVFEVSELPEWRYLTIPGPDATRLPAALMEPSERAPGKRYPVIMYQYGGPGSQVVADRWSARARALWHLMMAQRGYGVLKVDNPGSTFFGKTGEDRLHRRFGEINLAAQLAGAAYLSELEWVDPGRIGIWGWSGGGTNTLYVMTNSPGSWRAGVSGAPVTNWRLYDTIWTERYLDHPQDNPEGYRDSSPLTHAAGLADALLIVHGTADDNVHPHNTLQMVHALVEAGRTFEQAIYPRQKHGFRGGSSRHFYEKMTEFFDRHLKGD